MSFLLDALRKSEKQRRLGDVPNIHSATETESRSPRNPGLKAIFLPLLAAFLGLAWFGWLWYAPLEEAAVTQPSPQRTSGINTDNTGGGDSARIVPEIPRHPDTNTAQKPGRTAVERYSGPASSGSDNSESGNQGEPAKTSRELRTAADPPVLGESNTPMIPVTTVSGEVETLEGLATQGLAMEASVMNGSASMATISVQAQAENAKQEFRPGVISYWQLPESLRQQLRTFRISVIVFANRPQDRFILLNGVRLIEGDEPQPGLVLEEIRREGAVFSYRLYQFLVTQ